MATIYDNTVFKRFFELNDPIVLAWAENVFEKINNPGILPTFIEKGGEDFESFWKTVSHLFALTVIYSRQYNQIDVNKILFELFIESRGLVVNEVTTTEQMQYLFNNYINEYKKRGRMDIVSKEGVILGELLRLIQYQNLDEFIFAPLMARDIGWTMGYSSPTWNRTDTILNVTKGYEKTKSIEDLSKYPLINDTGVVLIDDVVDGNTVKVMTFVGDVLTGISSEIDKSKLLVISEDLAYQISFRIKVSDVLNSNLKFGVEVYDEILRKISCIETVGTTESNFFTPDGNITLLNSGIYYEFRATISKKNRNFAESVALNFLNGRGLKLQEGAKFLSLYLVQDRSIDNTSSVYIYDIKIKPLYLPFIQGYLGEKNVIASYFENNSLLSNSQILSFIEQYLISYKNIFNSTAISPITLNVIKFKVFSYERKLSLQGATIEINNQTLTTDINGEATIELYPGDYLYTVEKENYVTIENEVLSVLEQDSQIVYIPMQSDIYERKITFSVKDENDLSVSGATVTFNEQFKNTSADGTVVFYAFPGLYSYTVEKQGYYKITKSILVRDDIIEDVELLKIPIYSVTFLVKNNTTPISGATVTLTLKETTNGKVSLSGITNENGQLIFPTVIGGDYNYTVEKIDWLTESADILIDQDKVIDISFNPVPTYNVKFIVNDYDPISGNKVLLQNATVSFAGSTKLTNELGEASFIVKSGTYDYQISNVGNVSQSSSLNIQQDTVKTIDLAKVLYDVTFNVKGANDIPLKGASVIIGVKVIETDKDGIATFQLSNNQYNFTVKYEEYHDYTGEFLVNGAEEIVEVSMDQILYNLTFNVTETEGKVLVGAIINLNNGAYSGETDNQGLLIFNVPKGSYTYTISKPTYVTQTGNIDVVVGAVTKDINLVLKTTNVTFNVTQILETEGISRPSANARVICGTQSGYTNSEGKVTFVLSVGTYNYEISKTDFTTAKGVVNVSGDETQTVNVQLSNILYDAIITVVKNYNNASYPLQGMTVYFQSFVQEVTNSQGQATFTGFPNGTYSAEVAGGMYFQNSSTEYVTINNQNATHLFVMNPILVSTTVNVTIDGNVASGVSLSILLYDNAGIFYSSISVTTNDQGQATFTGPKGGSFSYSIKHSSCVTFNGMGNLGSTTSAQMYRALILSFNSKTSPSLSGSYISEWENNTTLKVQGGSQGNPSTLNISCSGMTSLLSVTQWPISFRITGNGTFQNCTSLNSVANGIIPISGDATFMFAGTTSLRTIYSQMMSNITGSSVADCFNGSGISLVPDNLFGSTPSNYQRVFANCTNLTTVSGSPMGSGGTDFGTSFQNCSRLTGGGLSSNTFSKATNATRFYYTFAGCTALDSVSSNLLYNQSRASTFTGFFESCTNLSSIPAGLFNRTSGQDFSTVCYGCTNLSSIGTNAFPTTATSFSWSFVNCKSLTDIGNMKRTFSEVTSWSRAFEGTNISVIPADFFVGHQSLMYVDSCFKNCKNLRDYLGNSYLFIKTLGNNPSVTNFNSIFEGCSNFNPTKSPFYLVYYNQQVMQGSISYAFKGCSIMTAPPVVYDTLVRNLWESSWTGDHVQTFNGATALLSRYSIPSSWK